MAQSVTVTLQMDGHSGNSQSIDFSNDGPPPPAILGQSAGDLAARSPDAASVTDAPPPALGDEDTSGATLGSPLAPPPPDMESGGQDITESSEFDSNNGVENPPPPEI
ncbi:MAG: hypothetical protein ABJQ70_14450 [Roseobacter sp.]